MRVWERMRTRKWSWAHSSSVIPVDGNVWSKQMQSWKISLKVPGFNNKQWEQTTVQFPWHCSFLNRCCTVTLLQMWQLKPCSSYLRMDQAGQIRKATNPSSRATNGIWHHPWHPGTVSTVFALGCAGTFTVSNKPHLFFELLRGTKLQGEEATLLQ